MNGSAEIKVVARYSVKLIRLLNVDITFDICQCASTKAWGAAKKTDEEVAKGNDSSEETSKPDETTSETQPEEPQKSLDDYAKEYTKNSSSDKVMLGSGTKLVSDAEHIGATYFAMGTDYDGNYDSWEIQKRFLEQNKSKTFYINTDPNKVTDSTLKKQILWLQDQGYSFKKNALGYIVC